MSYGRQFTETAKTWEYFEINFAEFYINLLRLLPNIIQSDRLYSVSREEGYAALEGMLKSAEIFSQSTHTKDENVRLFYQYTLTAIRERLAQEKNQPRLESVQSWGSDKKFDRNPRKITWTIKAKAVVKGKNDDILSWEGFILAFAKEYKLRADKSDAISICKSLLDKAEFYLACKEQVDYETAITNVSVYKKWLKHKFHELTISSLKKMLAQRSELSRSVSSDLVAADVMEIKEVVLQSAPSSLYSTSDNLSFPAAMLDNPLSVSLVSGVSEGSVQPHVELPPPDYALDPNESSSLSPPTYAASILEPASQIPIPTLPVSIVVIPEAVSQRSLPPPRSIRSRGIFWCCASSADTAAEEPLLNQNRP